MEPITLTTGRLLPRPFVPGDADALHTACQDPGIQRWAVRGPPADRSVSAAL